MSGVASAKRGGDASSSASGVKPTLAKPKGLASGGERAQAIRAAFENTSAMQTEDPQIISPTIRHGSSSLKSALKSPVRDPRLLNAAEFQAAQQADASASGHHGGGGVSVEVVSPAEIAAAQDAFPCPGSLPDALPVPPPTAPPAALPPAPDGCPEGVWAGMAAMFDHKLAPISENLGNLNPQQKKDNEQEQHK